MRARFGSLLVVTAALVAVAASPASATVMEALSFGDLARGASDVVEGEVTSRRVFLRRGMPWTDATVRVARVHMGATRRGQLITVRQPGGELGTVGLRVSGAAALRRGESVFLFVRPVGAVHVPVGMTQGKFELYKDSVGTWRARRDLAGVSLARLNPSGQVVIRHEVTTQLDPTLVSLRLQVKAAVQEALASKARAAASGSGAR